MAKGDWKAARKAATAWLRLDPSNIEARSQLVRCLIRIGHTAQAQTELEAIRILGNTKAYDALKKEFFAK